ncbi:hypothetical protein NL676_036568 [Syzygium grande]|nr:hypothetical protein NL676_036568 [Syzygium grande]
MLILERCENLEEFHPSIGNVKCLVSLNVRYCGSLEKLSEQLGKLEKLQELVLDETDIKEIPQSIGSLEKLKTLSAVGCRLLTQLPSSMKGLRLDVEALEYLRKLNLSTSTELSNLNDFEDLESLRYSDLQSHDEEADNLFVVGGLEKLGSLELLNISGRKYIELQLQNPSLTHLKELIVKNGESSDKSTSIIV